MIRTELGGESSFDKSCRDMSFSKSTRRNSHHLGRKTSSEFISNRIIYSNSLNNEDHEGGDLLILDENYL